DRYPIGVDRGLNDPVDEGRQDLKQDIAGDLSSIHQVVVVESADRVGGSARRNLEHAARYRILLGQGQHVGADEATEHCADLDVLREVSNGVERISAIRVAGDDDQWVNRGSWGRRNAAAQSELDLGAGHLYGCLALGAVEVVHDEQAEVDGVVVL